MHKSLSEKFPLWTLFLSLGFAVSLAYPLIFALADNYGMCGGCGTVTVRPEMIGFMIGGFALALLRKEFRTTPFSPLSPLLLGFATGMVLPEFFGCPWCMFMQLGYGKVDRLPEILGFIGGIWAGTKLLRRGISLEGGPQLRIPSKISFFLVICTILGTLQWMKINMEISGALEIFSMAGVVLVGILLGLAMQRIRFCVVEGVRNAFLIPSGETIKKGFASIIAMILGSLLYALGTETFDFSGLYLSSGEDILRQSFIFASAALAGIAFTLAGGCTVWHAVNTGNGSMHSLTFLGGMLAAAWLHKLPAFLVFTKNFQQAMFFRAPRLNALYRWIGAHTLYLLVGVGILLLILWINRRSLSEE
ncbi:MAG TPA: hypothetical protein PLW97_05615 [Synergistaceae bacterium]|nr:hypothetical protein [Synergistaceae bacterium]HPQ37107.1 hypothetical protein [Synergistaceae bacterium]